MAREKPPLAKPAPDPTFDDPSIIPGREPTVLTTVTGSRDGQTIRAVSNTPVATR